MPAPAAVRPSLPAPVRAVTLRPATVLPHPVAPVQLGAQPMILSATRTAPLGPEAPEAPARFGAGRPADVPTSRSALRRARAEALAQTATPSRKRVNAIAVAAVAVLGAVTTGAIVLPAHAEGMKPGSSAGAAQCLAPSSRVPMPSRTTAHHRVHVKKHSARHGSMKRQMSSLAAAQSSAKATPTAAASTSPTTSSTPSATAEHSVAPIATSPSRNTWTPDGLVRALRTILAGSPAGATTALGAGTFAFSDFASSLIGVDLGASGSLHGAGSKSTTIAMTAHSSSKSGVVPTADWTTNQLYLMSVTGASPDLAGFTLRGTAQGHLYNGLRVGQATNARVDDVTVAAIPGNNDIPPGETFGINDWRTNGSVYTNIEVDGSGRVGGSGFATNSSTNVTVRHGNFHDMRANGTAFWQTSGVTLDDVTVKNNVTGLNFERTTGTITVNDPTFAGNNQDVYLASDQGGGTLVIKDPTFGNTYSGHKINIQVPKTYRGVANDFNRSSVKVIIGGVDRTADVVHWVGNS